MAAFNPAAGSLRLTATVKGLVATRVDIFAQEGERDRLLGEMTEESAATFVYDVGPGLGGGEHAYFAVAHGRDGDEVASAVVRVNVPESGSAEEGPASETKSSVTFVLEVPEGVTRVVLYAEGSADPVGEEDVSGAGTVTFSPLLPDAGTGSQRYYAVAYQGEQVLWRTQAVDVTADAPRVYTLAPEMDAEAGAQAPQPGESAADGTGDVETEADFSLVLTATPDVVHTLNTTVRFDVVSGSGIATQNLRLYRDGQVVADFAGSGFSLTFTATDNGTHAFYVDDGRHRSSSIEVAVAIVPVSLVAFPGRVMAGYDEAVTLTISMDGYDPRVLRAGEEPIDNLSLHGCNGADQTIPFADLPLAIRIPIEAIDATGCVISAVAYGRSGAVLSRSEDVFVNGSAPVTLFAAGFSTDETIYVRGDVQDAAMVSLQATVYGDVQAMRARLCLGADDEVCAEQRAFAGNGAEDSIGESTVTFLLDPAKMPNGSYVYHALIDTVDERIDSVNHVFTLKTNVLTVVVDLDGVALEADVAQVPKARSDASLSFFVRERKGALEDPVLFDVTHGLHVPTDALCSHTACTLSVAGVLVGRHRYRVEIVGSSGETWSSNAVDVGVVERFVRVVVAGDCTLADAIDLTNGDDGGACTREELDDSATANAIALDDSLVVDTPYAEGSTTAFPTITGVTTLRGSGSVSRDDAPQTPQFRLLRIAPGAVVRVEGIGLSYGSVSDDDQGRAYGGCIYNEGQLYLSGGAWVSGCRAASDAGDSRGGGIYSSGRVLSISGVRDCELIISHLGNVDPRTWCWNYIGSNRAIVGAEGGVAQGGGIFIAGGTVALEQVSFWQNRLAEGGRGVALGGGLAAIGADIESWADVWFYEGRITDFSVQVGGGAYLRLPASGRSVTLSRTDIDVNILQGGAFMMGGGLYLAGPVAENAATVRLEAFTATSNHIVYDENGREALGGGAAFVGLDAVASEDVKICNNHSEPLLFGTDSSLYDVQMVGENVYSDSAQLFERSGDLWGCPMPP